MVPCVAVSFDKIHCVDHPEDTVEHTVEECPAWAVHHRVLVEAIGGGDLLLRSSDAGGEIIKF